MMPVICASTCKVRSFIEGHLGLQDLPVLLADNEQIAISGDIDFGVVSVTPPAAWLSQNASSGHLLSDLRTLVRGRDEAWDLDRDATSSTSCVRQKSLQSVNTG